jgi:acyl-CoA synthetase (AMP-forming)/AMP-acid ligase II
MTRKLSLTSDGRNIVVHLHKGDLPDGVSFDGPVAVDSETRGLSLGRDSLCLVLISGGGGAPVAGGASGEICVRGEQVAGEYLGRGSLLGSDGWFPTRDGGSMDDAGYLFIEGRIADVIVRGGENLSPGEIEDTLLEHEAVADGAVVGIPDDQWGEAVAAAVVTHAGRTVSADELRTWVKDRLRSSRAPQHVEFCAELPYNETGKLLRRKVKADLAARLAS